MAIQESKVRAVGAGRCGVVAEAGGAAPSVHVVPAAPATGAKTEEWWPDGALRGAQAGVAQAKAGVAQAKAGVAQAKAGVAQAKAGVAQAKAGVAQAKAGVAQAGVRRDWRQLRRLGGFSALELLATLGVAAVLAGLAVPGFAAFRRSAGVSSAANELVWALHLARSSAVLRGQPVTVCLSPDDSSCLQTSEGSAAGGWIVFQAAGQAVVPQAAPSGPILHRFRLPEAVAVRGTRPAVTFWPVARAGTTSTFEICDLEGRTPGRSIVVSQTGRPRVAQEAASCAV